MLNACKGGLRRERFIEGAWKVLRIRTPKAPETENPGIHIERCPKGILRGAVVDVQEGAR